MSHEIAQTVDGRASFAYVGRKAWHGLGQEIPANIERDELARVAGLDWSALVVPSQYEFNGSLHTAPNSFHMIRSDTGRSMSVMSKRYKPAQPAEIIAFFYDVILLDERFTIETAGALKGGNIIWALAKYVGTIGVNGEPHVAYVMLTTSFDGSLATTAQGTLIRVVCRNTMQTSLFSKTSANIRIPHYNDFSAPNVKLDAVDRLSKVCASFGHFQSMAEALQGVRLAAFQVEGLFKRLTIDKASKGDLDKKPSGKAVNQLEALLASYRDTLAEGTTGGTAWAALNAVTRYVDHGRITRDTAGDGVSGARMASSFFGSGLALKKEAVGVLAEIGNLELAD